MEWQSDHRASLDIFENRGEILKFYPLLDVTKKQRDEFIEEHELPFHPLVSKGFQSIGCTHCTRQAMNAAADGITIQKQNVDYTYKKTRSD